MSQSSPYYFVTPSDPDGDRFAYSKDGGRTPTPVFVQASWEWLAERAVRRLVLLKLVGAADAGSRLAERRGVYRVPHLLYGNYGRPAPGSAAFSDSRTDAPLRPLGLDVGVSSSDSPVPERVTVTPSELPGLVADVLEAGCADGRADRGAEAGPWFCDPDPAAWPSGRSTSASYLEVTRTVEPLHPVSEPPASQSSGSGSWDWSTRTEVRSSPFDFAGFLPVFRPLGDMRVDDVDERAVPVWDPEAGAFAERRMLCPRTPLPRSFDDDPDHGEVGEVFEYHDWPNRAGESPDSAGVLFLHGLTSLSRTFAGAVKSRVAADLGVYAGPSDRPWSRWDSEPDGVRRDSMRSFLGGLASAPPPSRTGLGALSGDSVRVHVHPAPDWSGKASCWEAWGLPDLSTVPPGSVLRRQLEAACSARPCIPPAAPALPASDDGPDAPYSREFPPAAPAVPPRPPCSAAPVNASLVLDRLLVTVHEVGTVFARVEASSEVSASMSGNGSREETGDFDDPESKSGSWTAEWTERKGRRGTYAGDFAGLVSAYGTFAAGWESASGSLSESDDVSYAWEDAGGREKSARSVWARDVSASASKSGEASAYGLVALRPGARPESGVVSSRSWTWSAASSGAYYQLPDEHGDPEDYSDADSGSESDGEVPEYRPSAGDLLFHPDVMAWMERAELFAVVCAERLAEGGTDEVETYGTAGRSSAVDGRRTSKAKYSVVRVGEMDLRTGEFPDLDLAELYRSAVPGGQLAGGSSEEGFGIGDDSLPSPPIRLWGGEASPWGADSSRSYVESFDADPDGSGHEPGSGQPDSAVSYEEVTRRSVPETSALAFRLCSAYVVVRWRFDGDPPSA